MRFLVMAVLMLLLTGCAQIREWEQEQIELMKTKTDFELCELVGTNAWPPTKFLGNFAAARVLEARSVPHYLCHRASKACVSFGYEFKSEAHHECTLAEGRNMSLVAAQNRAAAAAASAKRAAKNAQNSGWN